MSLNLNLICHCGSCPSVETICIHELDLRNKCGRFMFFGRNRSVHLTGRFVSGQIRFVCLTLSFFSDQNHFVRFFPGINGSTEPNRVPNGPPPVPPGRQPLKPANNRSNRLMTILIGYRLGTSAGYRPAIGRRSASHWLV